MVKRFFQNVIGIFLSLTFVGLGVGAAFWVIPFPSSKAPVSTEILTILFVFIFGLLPYTLSLADAKQEEQKNKWENCEKAWIQSKKDCATLRRVIEVFVTPQQAFSVIDQREKEYRDRLQNAELFIKQGVTMPLTEEAFRNFQAGIRVLEGEISQAEVAVRIARELAEEHQLLP